MAASGTETEPLITRPSTRGRRCFLPVRYVVSIMAFLGSGFLYTVRVNLSIALVAMVNHTALTQDDYPQNTSTWNASVCPGVSGSTVHVQQEDGPYVWDEEMQGAILSSFFMGYIITQIPGGLLADRYGGKRPFGIGILLASLLSLFAPLAASIDPKMLIVLRFLSGLGAGVVYPSLFTLLSKWYPAQERSRLSAISSAGVNIGTVVAFAVSGFLSKSSLGWPSVFYVFGGCGVVWSCVWFYVISESPYNHPTISEEERLYILEGTGRTQQSTQQRQLSCAAISCSLPVYALCIIRFTAHWSSYMLLADLPIFLSTIVGFGLTNNGMITSAAYLLAFLVSLLASFCADTIQNMNCIRKTILRKCFTALGILPCVACLLALMFVSCDKTAAVALLFIGIAFSGFLAGGSDVNEYDMAPNFAGTLKGINNLFASLAGAVAPLVTGVLTVNGGVTQWQHVFALTAGIHFFGLVVFLFFGSADPQPWKDGVVKRRNSMGSLQTSQEINAS